VAVVMWLGWIQTFAQVLLDRLLFVSSFLLSGAF